MPTSPFVQPARIRRAARVEAAGAAVEPVDHGLRAERLGGAADVRAAGRVERADALAQHDRVAARDVVVVERAGQVRGRSGGRAHVRGVAAVGAAGAEHALAGAGLLRHPVDVDRVVDRRPEVAAVRAVLEHDRNLVAVLLRLARAADADADAVLDPVAVGVEAGLDEHGLLDRVREDELRLRHAVLDLEPLGRLLRGRRRGGARERDQRREDRGSGRTASMRHGSPPVSAAAPDHGRPSKPSVSA